MSEPERRAFVAGATGYSGRAVVEAACSRGMATIAHIRPDSPRLASESAALAANGAQIDTTAWTLETMASALGRHRPTVVFALLGTTRKRASAEGMAATEAYRRVDYGLTALLIEAAATCDDAPRFVYLSAIGAREGTSNPYMRARVDAERDLRASGLPYTIVRPSFISGDDRSESRPGERAAAVVTDAALVVAGWLGATRFRDRYRSIDARTLAAALVRLALDPKYEGRVVGADTLR